MPQFERVKLPAEVLDYRITWKKRLRVDTIESSAWVLTNAAECGVNIIDQQIDEQEAVVWVTGGIPGKRANLINTITTKGGRVLENAATILIRAD